MLAQSLQLNLAHGGILLCDPNIHGKDSTLCDTSHGEARGAALRWLTQTSPTYSFMQHPSKGIPGCDLQVLFCLCLAFLPWISTPVPEQSIYMYVHACKTQGVWPLNHVCGLVTDQTVFTASLFFLPPRPLSLVYFYDFCF